MMGYLPGSSAEGILQENIDPIPNHDDGNGAGKGLELHRHIHYILRDEPDIWEMIERFKLGEFIMGEIWGLSKDAIDTYSAFEVSIVEIAIAVLLRKRARALKTVRN